MNNVVMKALALVEPVDDDSPTGSFDVVLSAPTLDRDGEIIDSKAFDPLPDHIPFDIDHTMSVAGTVGSGTPYYDDEGNLRVKGTFASTQLGQEVRTLVTEGHIRTTSVTFMAAQREQDEKGVDHVQQAELLNGTFTPIPSNRQATVLSAKAFQAAVDVKVGARNSSTDQANLQAAHDAIVAAGADCNTKSARPDGVKDVAPAADGAPAPAEDADEDPAALALAVDAALDAVSEYLAGDAPDLAQVADLVTAAETAVDALLDVMGLTDPDDAGTDTPAAAPTAAADATAAGTAKSADDEATQSRKALIELNAALLAF